MYHCHTCDSLCVISENYEEQKLYNYCYKCDVLTTINDELIYSKSYKNDVIEEPILTKFQLLDPTLPKSSIKCEKCNLFKVSIRTKSGKCENYCSNCF